MTALARGARRIARTRLAPALMAVGTAIVLHFTVGSGAATADEVAAVRTPTPELPSTPFDYDPELPAHLTMNGLLAVGIDDGSALAADNTPADNPTTDAGATLGRVLFYETRLSANGSISCASCHQQAAGFSDPAFRSEGLAGGRTSRHSMSLVNARFYEPGSFFWDTRAESLEAQVLEPIRDPLEMDLSPQQMVETVETLPYYESLFVDAFGDAEVTADRISKALAQFVRSMVALDAPYDRGRSQVDSPLDDFPDFSDQENFGKWVFFTGNGRVVDGQVFACASCHTTEAMIQSSEGVANNGLDFGGGDFGAFMVTNDEEDLTRFKVPSLRNIALSAPYMHDARFGSLEAVVRHYSSGVQPHPSLSPPLRTESGQVARFEFTQAEGDALVAFLRTLTDERLLGEAWSDPFTGPEIDFVPPQQRFLSLDELDALGAGDATAEVGDAVDEAGAALTSDGAAAGADPSDDAPSPIPLIVVTLVVAGGAGWWYQRSRRRRAGTT